MDAYTSFASVYDIFMDNIPYREWGEYLCTLLKGYGIPDGLVLDLGCGTGTMTEILADCGYDMIGVDNSADMLELAMEKRLESGHDILYLLQDMRRFELYGTVRAAVSVCDSINYITDKEELCQVFRLVNNYLDPSGVFLFDFNTDYKYREVLGDTVIAEDRGTCSFIWENYYYEEEKLNEYDLTLFISERTKSAGGESPAERPGEGGDGQNGCARTGRGELCRKFRETHYQRGYTLEEIKELLGRSGLVFIEAFDADTHGLPHEKSERIYVAAREHGKAKSG